MRKSKQREEILKVVLDSCDHPNAEAIYERVKTCLPNISLGTVYRNLCNLKDQNQIRQVHIAGEPDRYDKTLKEHSHFNCRICGCVSDINFDVKDICQTADSLTDFKVENAELNFVGICKNCLNKKAETSD